jgi:hypothetical protein
MLSNDAYVGGQGVHVLRLSSSDDLESILDSFIGPYEDISFKRFYFRHVDHMVLLPSSAPGTYSFDSLSTGLSVGGVL